MNYEHEYTEWKTLDGVTFPAGWHHHDGWDDERQVPAISGGHNGFGGSFPDIQINACPDAAAPALAREAAPRVESSRLGDGIWLIGGSTHNSVAVEFKDFVVVIEAPLDEARSLGVINEVVRLAPDKPVRFLVNTHNHYDHIGGLRTYLHIGATVITHQRNRLFYEAELLNYVPRTLAPDLVSLHPPTEIAEGYTIEDVDEKYIISDGGRNLDLYYVQGLGAHAEGMLMAWLGRERLLIEADMFDTHEGAAAQPDAAHRALLQNVKQLRLDVGAIVPIHGKPVAWEVFEKFVK
jgi:glyoxylase-like metal-dependent hydrolase (beta-lactamase superfamily II)